MNTETEMVKRSLAAVLPGMAVTLMGCLLMLACGVVIVTEGAPLLRSITAGLPPPWRSLVLLVALGVALASVGACGKMVMGYIITRKHEGDDE
jgi:hypothetical protein